MNGLGRAHGERTTAAQKTQKTNRQSGLNTEDTEDTETSRRRRTPNPKLRPPRQARTRSAERPFVGAHLVCARIAVRNPAALISAGLPTRTLSSRGGQSPLRSNQRLMGNGAWTRSPLERGCPKGGVCRVRNFSVQSSALNVGSRFPRPPLLPFLRFLPSSCFFLTSSLVRLPWSVVRRPSSAVFLCPARSALPEFQMPLHGSAKPAWLSQLSTINSPTRQSAIAED